MSFSEFVFVRPISYYETDAMGVVHHSNFIRLFEDARVAWLRERGLYKMHAPHSDLVFAVVDVQCQYLKPLRFGDNARVRLQVQNERAKLRFRYVVYRNEELDPACVGQTLHVALDKEFRIAKLPEALLTVLKEEQWTETWP